MLWRGTTRNDAETKTNVGLGSGESIEYTKHRVSLEGHPWPGCRPVSDTWYPYSYEQTKQKRGLNNVSQVNPEDCYLSRKDSGLQGRDNQVVKPYKQGRRGPAGRLTNVWNGHPTGPCPGRGDALTGQSRDGSSAETIRARAHWQPLSWCGWAPHPL